MSEEQIAVEVSTPSVKGSVFLMSVLAVKQLVAESRLTREEVEFELQGDDIRYLDEKILAEGWYPVGSFDRLASIAVEVLSDGEFSYLAEQGEAAAARVLGSQAYQGFIDAAATGREAGGPGASVLTMARLMLNFSRWELDRESSRGREFELRVTEAGDLPETLRYAGQGFIAHLATIFTREPTRVSSERLDQDTVVFRSHTR